MMMMKASITECQVGETFTCNSKTWTLESIYKKAAHLNRNRESASHAESQARKHTSRNN